MSNRGGHFNKPNSRNKGVNPTRGNHNNNMYAQAPPQPLLGYTPVMPPVYPVYPTPMYSYNPPQLPQQCATPYHVTFTLNQANAPLDYQHPRDPSPPFNEGCDCRTQKHGKPKNQFHACGDHWYGQPRHEGRRSSPPPPYTDHQRPRNPLNNRGGLGRNPSDAPPTYDSVAHGLHSRQRRSSTSSDASIDSRSSHQSHQQRQRCENHDQRFTRQQQGPDKSDQGLYDKKRDIDSRNDPRFQKNKRKDDDQSAKQKNLRLSMENLASGFKHNLQASGDNSRGNQSRGRGRGIGYRGRRPNRGRGPSQNRGSMGSKFLSTPNLFDNGHSENVDVEPEPPCPELRVTKVALQILKAFSRAEELKQTISQNLDLQENVEVKFVEDSIICSDVRGLCTMKLISDSKQSAKRVVKNLCKNLRKSLKVTTTYEMSNNEDEERNLPGPVKDKVEKKTSFGVLKQSTRRMKAEKYLSFIGQKNSQNQKTHPKEENLAKVINVDPQLLTEDKERSKKSEEKEPLPIPSMVSVTVGMSLSEKKDVEPFLKSVLDETEAQFTLLEDTVAISSSKTLFDIMVPSKAAASRIVKCLNSLNMGDVKVHGRLAGSPTKEGKTKADQNDALIVKTLEKLKEMSSEALDSHNKTIGNYEKALDAMSKPTPGEEEFEEDVLEELALREKLIEVCKVKDEFNAEYQILVDKVTKMESSSVSSKELDEVLKCAERACDHLAMSLPIQALKSTVVTGVKNNQVVVLSGAAGCGKSTQLVQYLCEAGLGTGGYIVCTQARKKAAVSLAEHVAKEMKEKVGVTVGCATDSVLKLSPSTAIVFSTDNCLLNESIKNPTFKGYSCIVVDDAQERKIYTDLLMCRIKNCLKSRPDLKVIIITTDQSCYNFVQYFGRGTEIRIPCNLFPVDLVYENSDSAIDFEQHEVKAVAKAISVHRTEGPGDMLIFLTSPLEIMRCIEEFEKKMVHDGKCKCFPLHENLSSDELRKVFQPLDPGTRKIIFATDCAETSFPVDNIRFIIDSGMNRGIVYDACNKIAFTDTYAISQWSANQRRDLAGHSASGKCFRLYSEAAYLAMDPRTKPKILTEPLGQVILKLAEFGTTFECDFPDEPSTEMLQSNLQTLQGFFAVTPQGITDIGVIISKLDLDPRLGYMIYLGYQGSLLYDSIVLAALISHGSGMFYKTVLALEDQPSPKLKGFTSSEYGDIFFWRQLYQDWLQLPRAEQSNWCHDKKINYKVLGFVRYFVTNVEMILKKEKDITVEQQFAKEVKDIENLRKIIFQAFMASTCRYLEISDDVYSELVSNRQVHISTSSTTYSQRVKPRYIIYTDVSRTHKIFVKGTAIIEENWVTEAIAKDKLPKSSNQVKVVHREEVGFFLLQQLQGPRGNKLRHLEEMLSSKGMRCVTVETDKHLGTLEIFSASLMNQEVSKYLRTLKTESTAKLLEDEEELPIMKDGHEQSGMRVLLEQGGLVKAILMPHQSNKIIITNTRSQTTAEEVCGKFQAYGEIKECTRATHPNHWGYIRYSTCQEAELAVTETSRDKKMAAALKVEAKSRQTINKFDVKLSWCRRPIIGAGVAFIKCPPIERSLLTGKSLKINERLLTIERSRKEEELELIIHNTGDVQERDIKKALMDLLDYDQGKENNIHISLNREKVKPLSKEVIKQTKSELYRELKRLLPSNNFNISLISPKENSVHQIGYLHFDNVAEGLRACHLASNHLTIRGQVVDISPNLKISIHIPLAVMEAVQSQLDDIKFSLQAGHGVLVNTKKKKQGDCAMDVISSSPQDLLHARDLLLKELEGEIIHCDTTEQLCLMKHKGRSMLSNLKEIFSVAIIIDDCHKKIHLYGKADNVQLAKLQINQFVYMIYTSVKTDFPLKGKSPQLLKELLSTYSPFPEKMIDTFDLIDVVIDLKQWKATLMGSPESVQKTLFTLIQLEESLQKKPVTKLDRWMPQCVFCKMTLDPTVEMYRLGCCGHSYCKSCISGLVSLSLQGRKFPLRCFMESCGQLLMVKDFQYFFSQKWLTKALLVAGSLEAFVERNAGMYRFCITPNCPVVYEVSHSEEGAEFNCRVCSVSLCTSCHTWYHAGLPCNTSRLPYTM